MSERRQRFHASLAQQSPFEQGHLRPYFADRDLGIADATGGMVTALVHRAVGPVPKAERHYHAVEFQMNYVLAGWCRFEFEGEGEFTFRQGDAWLQPPAIRHTLLEMSEDFEVLEIVMPARFETTNV